MSYICPKCNKQVLIDYPPPCPNCGQCFHYRGFGSDLRCPKCGQKHYWYGYGWLDVKDGKTVFPSTLRALLPLGEEIAGACVSYKIDGFKVWKCKNLECGRIFPMLGRISVERRMPSVGFSPVADRTIVEKPCCPFCESLEFEEIKEESNIEWVRADTIAPADIVPRKKEMPRHGT